MKAKYDITGMNCAACSAAVERAIKKLGIGYNCFYSEDNFTPEDLVNKIRMD